MKVFRITKKKYQNDLSGKGAELFGGRWNPIGTAALYTSETRALCVLELLAHTPKEIMPETYIIQTIEIPSKLEREILKLDIDSLDKSWNSLQPQEWTENIGLEYFNKGKLGISVPSAIINMEFNIVLNPLHPKFNKISIVEKVNFELDRRLLK